jgi:hypothetical protein
LERYPYPSSLIEEIIMVDSSDKFDFSDPLPPEVPDGAYEAHCKAVKLSPKPDFVMFFVEMMTDKALDEANGAGEGKTVSMLFTPKARGHKFFNSFARSVKEICAAFDVSPPQVSTADLGTAEGWEDFLNSLVGKGATIYVKNEADKKGEMRCNVRLSPPKGATTMAVPAEDEAPAPKGKKGKK